MVVRLQLGATHGDGRGVPAGATFGVPLGRFLRHHPGDGRGVPAGATFGFPFGRYLRHHPVTDGAMMVRRQFGAAFR